MKTIIERGASWTLEETKLLLALWGQDLVQRQATNQKRTKEVYEKISEKFNQSGFERTADQVRTRVFNMIAEYRRILKDPNPERVKKCIFFEALHKIYQAKHMDDVKSALDDYEPEYPYSPASNTISSEKGEESISDSEAQDGNEALTNNQSTATNVNDNNNHGGVGSGASGNSGSGANSIANNNTNTYSASATSDNNSDSINSIANDNSGVITNNSTENSNSHPTSAKKIKLESPKSGTSHSTNPSEHANTKQNKSSSNQTGSSNSASAASSASNSALGTSGNSTNAKHQSLLLPHGTTSTSSSTSTPITKLTSSSNATPSYININQTKLPIIRTNQLLGNESINLNGTTTTRLPTTAAITSHQLYQAPVNTFDVTSSALLIDRMFAHLSRESENMREWIALEKERLALERVRRAQETEREVRRERVLIDTLMRFQEQWISFLTRLGPGVLEGVSEPPPELKLPPTDGAPSEAASQTTLASGTQSVATTNTSANTSTSSSTSTSGSCTATTSSTTTSSNTIKQ